MRSPLGARFPSRWALGIGLLLAMFTGACTGDGEPAPQASPTTSPIPTESEDDGNGTRDKAGSDVGPEAEVVLRDKDSKRTVRGEAPAYVEIKAASASGYAAEGQLVFGVTLAGKIPEQMPDRHSVLRVTFRVVTADGRRYTFEGQCVQSGWGSFQSGGPDAAPLPDIALRNDTMGLVVDPAYIGGLQPFEWVANVAWTSGDANYAFDAAPTKGFADYP